MAFNLLSWERVAGLFSKDYIAEGSLFAPVSLSVTGLTFERTVSIAASANATVYNDELSGFAFMRVVADKNTRMVLTDDASNTFAIPLYGTGTADSYGIPFVIGRDDTSSGQVINSVVVHNDGSTAAKVKILVVK